MKAVVKSVNWLAAAVLVVAVGMAWLQPIHFFGNPDWASPVVQLAMVLGLLVMTMAGRQVLKQLSSRQYRWLLIGLVGLIAIVQILIATSFVDVARADPFFVRQQALLLARGSHHWQHYFMIYPNNVNFTLLVANLLKPLLKLTQTPWVLLNVIRFIWIDTGLISGLYLLNRWRYWQPGAVSFSLLWLVSVPVAAFGLFAYTDALVLPLLPDSLALLTLGLSLTGWRRWGVLIGDGLLVAVGVVMKTNLIVLWLTLVLMGIILWWQRQFSGRQMLGWLVSLVMTLGVMFAVMRTAQQQAGYTRQADAALPATSWIAMSLNPQSSGEYRHGDFARVNQMPTAAAKRQQTQQMIQQRLHQMGVTGTLVHLLKKMRVFWATGDFDSFKLTTQWIRAPRWYLNHQRQLQFWLVLMTQTIYLTMLVQAIVTLMKRREWAVTFVALAILGLTAFHVGLWEVEGRYALPLLPGLMLLSIVGGRELPVWHLNRVMRRQLTWLVVVLAAISVVSLWQTSQATRVTDVVRGNQGNGRYVVSTVQKIGPGHAVTTPLAVSGKSNVLRLKPVATHGRVTITLTKGAHVVKRWRGSANELTTLNYPLTAAGNLRLAIKNIGQTPVRYGVMAANYSPLTGRVTAKRHAYLQVVIKQQFIKPHALTTGAASLAVVGCVALATILALGRLRPETE